MEYGVAVRVEEARSGINLILLNFINLQQIILQITFIDFTIFWIWNWRAPFWIRDGLLLHLFILIQNIDHLADFFMFYLGGIAALTIIYQAILSLHHYFLMAIFINNFIGQFATIDPYIPTTTTIKALYYFHNAIRKILI